jgi:CRISPR/Cas system Type II protein with McrA/HNH and RuvC-like nuclease domain
MAQSQYLAGLEADQRTKLEQKLLARQTGRCFICDNPIDLMLHKGQLDIDHIDPLVEDGLDAENNFALTHSSCNRSKGAANLEIARRLAEFERLQERAQEGGSAAPTWARCSPATVAARRSCASDVKALT